MSTKFCECVIRRIIKSCNNHQMDGKFLFERIRILLARGREPREPAMAVASGTSDQIN